MQGDPRDIIAAVLRSKPLRIGPGLDLGQMPGSAEAIADDILSALREAGVLKEPMTAGGIDAMVDRYHAAMTALTDGPDFSHRAAMRRAMAAAVGFILPSPPTAPEKPE